MQRYKTLFINQLQKWTFLSDEVRKKYPILLGNVSKDKSPSIQYYFAKYPCFVFSSSLPQSGEKGCGIGCSSVFVAQRSEIVQNGKSLPPSFPTEYGCPGL